MRSRTFFGGELEANIAGGAINRGVYIHRDGNPPYQVYAKADDNPIRLLYNGRDHYDLYRSTYNPDG